MSQIIESICFKCTDLYKNETLWVSQWIIDSIDSFKNADLHKRNTWLFYEWADSFKEQNKQLFLWVSHLITYSTDSLKKYWLIQEKKSSDCFISELVNHSTDSFKHNAVGSDKWSS